MPIIRSEKEINGETISILIEVDKVPEEKKRYGDVRANTFEKTIVKARDAFGDGLELVQDCAKRVVEAINNIKPEICPDEFQVQLSIKLDAEVGAILAKASTEAQMQVSMNWLNNNKKGNSGKES